ncbi:MAG TPA: NAD-dependent epimerase/dehydratase family protein [Candidatus Dormibacteraeota bacterium]|nr:NAD-dependent epimerase/dehydratase family protein [Candidatus Dormibacteraeota bacterium]
MDPNLLAIERRGRAASGPAQRRILITGGAGFLGVNTAQHLINDGWHITVFDNLSRPGTERNLKWLVYRYPHRVTFVKGDVRDAAGLAEPVRNQDAILHLAAQAAPEALANFEVNAHGTLNLLEATRAQNPEVPFVFASSRLAVDPVGPYAPSKTAAELYVRDFAQSFDMNSVVLRLSTIYGTHQYGAEEEGWVAKFVHCILKDRPFSVEGDGTDAHDLLDVRDFNAVCSDVIDGIDRARGEIYDIGGGSENKRTVLEVIDLIAKITNRKPNFTLADHEHQSYVSDLSKAEHDLDWKPRIAFDQGLHDLIAWAQSLD